MLWVMFHGVVVACPFFDSGVNLEKYLEMALGVDCIAQVFCFFSYAIIINGRGLLHGKQDANIILCLSGNEGENFNGKFESEHAPLDFSIQCAYFYRYVGGDEKLLGKPAL